MLCTVDWKLFAEILGQLICPKRLFLDCSALKDGSDRLSRNVSNWLTIGSRHLLITGQSKAYTTFLGLIW